MSAVMGANYYRATSEFAKAFIIIWFVMLGESKPSKASKFERSYAQ